MGTGSEVEAGGLDGMSRLVECVWVLLMLLTEVPHGACSRAEVQGYRDTYNRGVWPGVADEVRTLKYLCTWYLGRAGAVRFGGGSNNAGTRARHTLAVQRPHSQRVAPPTPNIASAMMILWHSLFTRRRHRLQYYTIYHIRAESCRCQL